MSAEMLERQVRALRATAASLLAQLEVLAESLEKDVPCEHPEKERDLRVATFDQPERWMCKRCGFMGGEKAAKE